MKIARRGFSTKALLICLAILIGLLACPIYAIYCIGFSGKSIAEHEVHVGEAIPLQLSPEMNPIRFVATIKYEHPRNVIRSRSSSFKATLRTTQSECWTQPFRVEVDNDSTRTDTNTRYKSKVSIGIEQGGTYPATTVTNIHSFNVDSSDDYSLLVSAAGNNELKVNSISLSVRRNVRQINVPVAVGGGILLVLGVIVGFISLMLRKPSHSLETVGS